MELNDKKTSRFRIFKRWLREKRFDDESGLINNEHKQSKPLCGFSLIKEVLGKNECIFWQNLKRLAERPHQ